MQVSASVMTVFLPLPLFDQNYLIRLVDCSYISMGMDLFERVTMHKS